MVGHHGGVDAVIPALHRPPIAFAHRGASAHASENSIEAFRLAIRLGATGIASDVWLTADGHPVLDRTGTIGRLWRRRPISRLARDDLPAQIPPFRQLLAELDPDVHLALDVKSIDAVPAVLAALSEGAGPPATRIWLCHSDWRLLAKWRLLSDDIRLVASTRIGRVSEAPERLAASLAEAGIDALRLHWSDWTGGLTTLVHRFDRFAFGWDAQHERAITTLVRMGIDGLFGDHVDRLVEGIHAGPGVRGT